VYDADAGVTGKLNSWSLKLSPAVCEDNSPPAGSNSGAGAGAGSFHAGASLSKQKLRKALKRGLKGNVDLSGNATVGLNAMAGKTSVASTTQPLTAGKKTVVLKFSKKAKRKLRSKRRVKLTLAGTATDRSGTKASLSAKQTLKR